MYLVLVEKSGAEDGLSSIEIMFYNSFLSLPFLSFLIIVTGEFPNSISLLLAKVRNFHHPKLAAFLSYSSLKGFKLFYSLLQCSYLPFLVMLVLSLVMGIVLNFTMFLCTIVNSALTTTIVGVLKGVGSTVSILYSHLASILRPSFSQSCVSSCLLIFQTLGFVLLGGVEVHALNVSGLVVNTAGGVWYSYAKYRQKKAKPAKTLSDLEAHKK